jgi:hypothetical protein
MLITDTVAEYDLLVAINRYITESHGEPLSIDLVETLDDGAAQAEDPTPSTPPTTLPPGVLPRHVVSAVWRDRDTHAALIKYNSLRRSRLGNALCGKPVHGKSQWDVPLATVTCGQCRRHLAGAGELADAA